MWKLAAFYLTITTAATFAAAVADDAPAIKLADCPAAVQKTLKEESRGATIDRVTKETEDEETSYWTTVKIDDNSYEIGVDKEGALIEMALNVGENDIKLADCPAAVQKSLRKEGNGADVDEVFKDLRYGVSIFATVVPVDGKDYEIVVAEDGTLVEKTLLIMEDEIDLAHTPTAVQKALKEEARGGKIGEIVRSTGIRGHVFEAEVKADNKLYLIEVSEGGMLISKTLEDAL